MCAKDDLVVAAFDVGDEDDVVIALAAEDASLLLLETDSVKGFLVSLVWLLADDDRAAMAAAASADDVEPSADFCDAAASISSISSKSVTST